MLMNSQMIILGVGTLLIIGLLVYAFFGSSSGKSGARRLTALKLRHSDSADSRVEAQLRKAVSQRRNLMFNTGEKVSPANKIRMRLAKTGKNWVLSQYMYASGAIAFVLFCGMLIKGLPFLLALCVGLIIGFGLPHMVVGFLINKRLKLFTTNFPDAIELLVRGLKSGLPVGETINIVAKEVPGPVGEEFKLVSEKVKIGKSMEDSLQETADRMGTAEFQFFVITLAIQRETGGNLAETLAGLADVLRKRAQMKLKIRAMSSESKASAYIVGSLPFFVFGMIWMVNQKYLAGFFYEPRLMVAGLIGAAWMSAGVFIMSKMVSFEI
jgi:tight adherence protein B